MKNPKQREDEEREALGGDPLEGSGFEDETPDSNAEGEPGAPEKP